MAVNYNPILKLTKCLLRLASLSLETPTSRLAEAAYYDSQSSTDLLSKDLLQKYKFNSK